MLLSLPPTPLSLHWTEVFWKRKKIKDFLLTLYSKLNLIYSAGVFGCRLQLTDVLIRNKTNRYLNSLRKISEMSNLSWLSFRLCKRGTLILWRTHGRTDVWTDRRMDGRSDQTPRLLSHSATQVKYDEEIKKKYGQRTDRRTPSWSGDTAQKYFWCKCA